jgi:hypothetical protein
MGESFKIDWIRDKRFETNLLKSGFMIHDTKRIFLKPGFVVTIRYESMDSQNESMFLRISYTNPASLVITNNAINIDKVRSNFTFLGQLLLLLLLLVLL